MKISVVELYTKYRKLGLSHVEACRKIQADARLPKLIQALG